MLRAELGADAPDAHHGAHPRRERQPAAGAHLRLARPRQDRVPQARRLHVRRELRRHRRRPAAATRSRVDRPIPRAARRARRASTRRGSRRSSRCCSPSTRCTATCTGITRCAAPRRCTSGSSDGALRAGSLERGDARGLHRRGAAPRARPSRAPQPVARRAARAAPVQARVRVPRRRAAAGGAASGSPTTARSSVAVEDRLARELGLAPGELLLDYPDEDADARPRHPRAAPRTAACAGSPPRDGRARSTCRSCRRSSTAARAGCACSRADR